MIPRWWMTPRKLWPPDCKGLKFKWTHRYSGSMHRTGTGSKQTVSQHRFVEMNIDTKPNHDLHCTFYQLSQEKLHCNIMLWDILTVFQKRYHTQKSVDNTKHTKWLFVDLLSHNGFFLGGGFSFTFILLLYLVSIVVLLWSLYLGEFHFSWFVRKRVKKRTFKWVCLKF